MAIGMAALAACASPAPNAIAPPQDRAARLQWIDVHMHLVGGRGPSADFRGAVAAALEMMDEAGIAKAVVLPPPQVHGTPPPFDSDDFVEAIRPYRSRLAFLGGGGSLNPLLQEATQREVADPLRRRFEERALTILRQGAAGFGEITAHHLSHTAGHPYESVAADHPLLRLLADVAARHDVVIDLHLDVVVEHMKAPEWLPAGLNPTAFAPNLAAFERLLDHNRGGRIVWAHAGSDMLGHWTVNLSRRLLAKHTNLFMSLRMMPGRVPGNHPLTPAGTIKPEWLRLLGDFPDRFMIGGDQFIVSPRLPGAGPAIMFSRLAPRVRERTRVFLEALPPDLALRIASTNATRIYRLGD